MLLEGDVVLLRVVVGVVESVPVEGALARRLNGAPFSFVFRRQLVPVGGEVRARRPLGRDVAAELRHGLNTASATRACRSAAAGRTSRAAAAARAGHAAGSDHAAGAGGAAAADASTGTRRATRADRAARSDAATGRGPAATRCTCGPSAGARRAAGPTGASVLFGSFIAVGSRPGVDKASNKALAAARCMNSPWKRRMTAPFLDVGGLEAAPAGGWQPQRTGAWLPSLAVSGAHLSQKQRTVRMPELGASENGAYGAAAGIRLTAGKRTLRGNWDRNAAAARRASSVRPNPARDFTRRASRSSASRPFLNRRVCSAITGKAAAKSPRTTAARAR